MNATASPQWLKKKIADNRDVPYVKGILSEFGVNTVCESSMCPNLNECFSRKFAAFLILGRGCTRRCGFCAAGRNVTEKVDAAEPSRIAGAARRLGIAYTVITSVTRDDLPDGGSGHFVRVVEEIRRLFPRMKIELLVPDFAGESASIDRVAKSRPYVLGHNVETVRRLYPLARRGSDYTRSIGLLARVKEACPDQITKSSLMLGLGEEAGEIMDAMFDLRKAGCDIISMGQYLAPGKENLPAQRFVRPEEFEMYEKTALRMGFSAANAGPFVRSSYLADLQFEKELS